MLYMSIESFKPTERFSDRVDDYIKFRPRYPKAVLEFFISRLGLQPGHVIADVGSGTGISSEMFLKNGNKVFGIEPNTKMREAGEKALVGLGHFLSVSGTAEKTGLESRGVDFVVAAQAFHWFKPDEAKKEFARILKSPGYVALIWNDRKIDDSEFSKKYEKLILEFGTDYKHVAHQNINEDAIKAFLGKQDYGVHIFPNLQILDFPSLLGRLTSSSYIPNTNHPRFEDMKNTLKNLYDQFQKDGFVQLTYDTKVYFSRFH